jgi:hypothetical protein
VSLSAADSTLGWWVDGSPAAPTMEQQQADALALVRRNRPPPGHGSRRPGRTLSGCRSRRCGSARECRCAGPVGARRPCARSRWNVPAPGMRCEPSGGAQHIKHWAHGGPTKLSNHYKHRTTEQASRSMRTRRCPAGRANASTLAGRSASRIRWPRIRWLALRPVDLIVILADSPAHRLLRTEARGAQQRTGRPSAGAAAAR